MGVAFAVSKLKSSTLSTLVRPFGCLCMHPKRATSLSVADLHLQTVEDNIKRLAIDKDNQPHMTLRIKDIPPSGKGQHAPILTVMSSARDDFNSRYDIIREIGKGGFSTVYQCRRKQDGMEFAVKV